MSIVAVHGPNTMYTTQSGGTAVKSSPLGATATKSPTNGLVYSFSFPNPGARPAADFDWTFTGPGSPAAQADRTSGTVTFTGPGAVTIVCTVAAGAGPPAGGTYTVSATATAGTPRSARGGDEDEEDEVTQEIPTTEDQGVEVGYDPAAHTVDEVKQYVTDNPDSLDDMYQAEMDGKARSTLVTWLEEQFPFDPGEYTVAEVLEYAEANPDQLDEIIEAEEAGKNRSTLVSQLTSLRSE